MLFYTFRLQHMLITQADKFSTEEVRHHAAHLYYICIYNTLVLWGHVYTKTLCCALMKGASDVPVLQHRHSGKPGLQITLLHHYTWRAAGRVKKLHLHGIPAAVCNV